MIRCRSNRLKGCVPAEPTRSECCLGDRGDVLAELPELGVDLGGRPAHRRRDLEHRLHELGLHLRFELVTHDRRQEGVDVLDEVEALRVEEHVLLLDSEGVRISLPEGVVEDAAARGEAVAGDARRVDLLHHLP